MSGRSPQNMAEHMVQTQFPEGISMAIEGLWFRGYPHKIWPKIWYPGISIDFLSKAAVILGYQMDQQRIGSAKATKRQSKRSGVRMKCTTCFFRHFFPKSPNNTKHMVYDVHCLPKTCGFTMDLQCPPRAASASPSENRSQCGNQDF